MKQGLGLPVFSGVAIGPAVVYRKSERVQPVACGTPDAEQKRFDDARETARQQLQGLYDKAAAELGEEKAAIIEVQMLMLEDLDYLEAVAAAIADGTDAATAALDCGEEFAQVFAALDDEYMKARSADIRDLSHRIYDILCGNTGFQLPEGSFLLVAQDLAPSETIQLPRERILAFITQEGSSSSHTAINTGFQLPEGSFLLVAQDLAPSETIQLPRERILAFITQEGSSSSHTAILARTLNIPSLVQSDIDLDTAENCTVLAVDGFTGKWYADPDEQTMAMLKMVRRSR